MDKFLLLLNEFHPPHTLNMYTHRFLIFKHEHPGILQMGQPEDRLQADGTSLGHTALEAFIIVDGKKWTFDNIVQNLLDYYEI